jgi:hypothetical protein
MYSEVQEFDVAHFCAILHASAELIHLGIDDLIKETIKKSADKSNETTEDAWDYKDLVKLLTVIVLTNADGIWHSVIRMKQDEQHQHLCNKRSFEEYVLMNHKLESLDSIAQLSSCTIEHQPQKGRCLIAEQGIGKGMTILEESPYLFTFALSCQCREEMKNHRIFSHLLYHVNVEKK